MVINYNSLISEAEKITETKTALKKVANDNGGEITNETAFSEYPDIFISLLNRTLTADEIANIVNAIPTAKDDIAGIVKSSTNENSVSVLNDGTMVVNDINLSKIVQTEEDELVLQGGDSENIK